MIRSCHCILSAVLLTLFAAACQEPMEAASTVSKFRVLAVQAEPPEAASGETVTHRVLYADPEGEGRTVMFFWKTCLGEFKPSSDLTAECISLGNGFGAVVADEIVFETEPVTDIFDEKGFGKDKPELYEALMAKYENNAFVLATTAVGLCAGGEPPDLTDLPGGEDTSIADLESLCVGGDFLMAFKTFRISEPDRPNRNTNPTIDYVVFNGNRIYPTDPETGLPTTPPLTVDDAADKCTADDSCPAGDGTKSGVFYCETTSECLDGAPVKAYMTDDSFETYEETVLGETTQQDESPYISWFMDGGAFSTNWSRAAKPPGPFNAVWSPPQAGGQFTLYVVAHDLRGGTSWQRYAVEAVSSALD